MSDEGDSHSYYSHIIVLSWLYIIVIGINRHVAVSYNRFTPRHQSALHLKIGMLWAHV